MCGRIPGIPRIMLSTIGCLGLLATTAHADRIRLKGGGELQGTVRLDPDRPEVRLVQTRNGSSLIEFSSEDIVEVIVEEDILDEYDRQLADLAETAEAHHQLGLWCEKNRLTGLANLHFRQAAELDPEFEPAQKKLGMIEHDGQWMTYDEMRTSQGLVKHHGRWIPREELDRIESLQANRAEHEAIVRQVRVLRQGLLAETLATRGETERQLFELARPEYVAAFVEVLGDSPDPRIRDLLVRLLSSINAPQASLALIGRVLGEGDQAIRRGAIAELSRRGDPEVSKRFVTVMASKNPQVRGRAAEALAMLGATDAVPKLIAALVRIERRPVWVPTVRPAAGPVPVSGLNITGRSVPVLTGPTVGDGVVAYGATSVPFGSGVGINAGSGGMVPGNPELRIATQVVRHPEVLAALEVLTAQNFGFDQATWKRWHAQSLRDRPQVYARRVPQP